MNSKAQNLWAQKLFLAVLFIVTFLCFFMPRTSVFAQALPTTTDLDGYAWSSTIGWISLNCRTGGLDGADAGSEPDNICATSNYKVTINSNRTVTGYAWSSNVGWIKFDGLSMFPSGAGTVGSSARVAGTYPNLNFEGWARACAGTSGGTCASMVDNSAAGSWDGWISLRGTDYQVNTNNAGMANNSYAWGSNVVGWIDMFSEVSWLKATGTIANVGTCTVLAGNSTCNAPVTWSTQYTTAANIRNNSTNDHYSSSTSGTNQLFPLRLGTNSIALREGAYVLDTFSRTLSSSSCEAGATIIGSTCEFPLPSVSMSVSRPIVRVGDTVTVTWVVTPEPIASGSCTLSGPGLATTTLVSGTRVSSPLKSKSNFTITCTGGFGTVSASAAAEVIAVAKEV